jgi:hypothetical protein
MQKAYDVNELLNMMKADGLDMVESQVGKVYKNLKEWAQKSAVLSENKIDDIVAPFANHLDPILLPLIDKIDGQVG